MQRGDISIYSDNAGGEHVAIVTETHEDGSVDLAVLKTSLRAVPRSATKVGGTFFDPNWVEEAPAQPTEDAPPANVGLSSVPLVTDAQIAMGQEGNYSNLLKGSSSPAGLWPPRNLEPVEGLFSGDVIRAKEDGSVEQLAEGKVFTGDMNTGEIQPEETPVEDPAHGAPADVTPPESA